jgi:hypothetical protein
VAPNAVKEAINRELPGILKDIFAGNKTEYNFSTDDRLDQITVSDPFRIRGIDVYDFQEFLKNPSINSISGFSDNDQSCTWYAIVKANDIGKWRINVRNVDGKWKIVEYGGDPAAEDFNKLFKIYSPKDVVLFGNSPSNTYYYHIKSKGEKNLTKIDHQKISALAKTTNNDEIKNAFGKETDISEIADKELTRMNGKNWRRK